MLIIIDKTTKEIINNMGTNSACPDGNLPYELKDNEEAIRIHDNSEVAQQIMSAYKYELILGETIGVNVIETLEEFTYKRDNWLTATQEGNVITISVLGEVTLNIGGSDILVNNSVDITVEGQAGDELEIYGTHPIYGYCERIVVIDG